MTFGVLWIGGGEKMGGHVTDHRVEGSTPLPPPLPIGPPGVI